MKRKILKKYLKFLSFFFNLIKIKKINFLPDAFFFKLFELFKLILLLFPALDKEVVDDDDDDDGDELAELTAGFIFFFFLF